MNQRLSIIIPVFNEEMIINNVLSNLFSLSYDKGIEIIIVDGDPGGATIGIIRSSLSCSSNVKTLTAPKGRAWQMNRGAAMATGDPLLFLHADSFINQKVLDEIPRILSSSNIVGGAFDLAIRSEKIIYRLIEAVANIRSRTTQLPYGDQAVFLRKCVFRQLNGFTPITLMEDVEIMQRIKKNGWKIRISSTRVQTSPRRWEKEGPVYCTLRNWALISLYMLGASPKKLARFYK